MSPNDLGELLARYLASDDEDAMAALVERTRPRLLGAARRICRDDAEDAVQQAYLSLVKRREAPPVVEAYLLTAVVRVAYRLRAKGAKEDAIAARLAQGGVRGPEADAAEREEAELVRREVWKLPAPYRDALQLFHLHGLSAAETARLLEVNESTLRTRLQRGRLLLRSRLAKVLYPVLALPWLLADHAAAAVLAGGLAMKAKLAAAAVLVLALAGGGLFWLREDAARGETRERAAIEAARGAPPAAPAPPLAPAQEESAEPSAAYAAGTVVDEEGRGLNGVRVVPRGVYPDEALKSSFERLPPEKRAEMRPDAHVVPDRLDDDLRGQAALAVTGGDGGFRVDREPVKRHSLLFLKDGYALGEETAVGPEMRVVLRRAPPFHGRVTDTSDAPIPGAFVRLAGGSFETTQDTRTDGDGRFALRSPPPGPRGLYATATGYDHQFRRDPAPGAPEDFRLVRRNIVVEAACAETGAPLGRAYAWLRSTDGRARHIGGDAQPRDPLAGGRLVVPIPEEMVQGAPVDALVYVIAPGYQGSAEPVELRPDAEPPHLRVKLAPGDADPSIAGVVTGAPAAHIVVRRPELVGQDADRWNYITELHTGAGGRFALCGLPPGRYLLVVTAPERGKVTHVAQPGDTDIAIELVPAATLEVRARDRAGRAVAGTTIHVEAPGRRYQRGTTDPEGRAVFEGLPAGVELRVLAVVQGWDSALQRGVEAQGVTLAAGETGVFDVTVPERVAVSVVVRDELGLPHEGVVLGFQAREGLVRAIGRSEWERLKDLRVTSDAAGAIPAELYAGTYEVRLHDGTPVRIGLVEVGEEGAVEAAFVVPRQRPGPGRQVRRRDRAQRPPGQLRAAGPARGSRQPLPGPAGRLREHVGGGRPRRGPRDRPLLLPATHRGGRARGQDGGARRRAHRHARGRRVAERAGAAGGRLGAVRRRRDRRRGPRERRRAPGGAVPGLRDVGGPQGARHAGCGCDRRPDAGLAASRARTVNGIDAEPEARNACSGNDLRRRFRQGLTN